MALTWGEVSRPLNQEVNNYFNAPPPQGHEGDWKPVTRYTQLGTGYTQLSGWALGQREREREREIVVCGVP
jgi:hypothetical protein